MARVRPGPSGWCMVAWWLLACGSPEEGIAPCGDRDDNDHDGLTDCADPACDVLCQVRPPDAVVIEPDPAYDSDVLRCAWQGDLENAVGGMSAATFAWTEDGAVLDGEREGVLLPERTQVGSTYACTATATSEVNVEEGTSQPVVVENRSPPAPGLAVEPANPTTDQELTCTVTVPSVDPDGHPVTLAFSWYRFVAFEEEEELGTGATYGPDAALASEQVRCGAVPSDGYGDGEIGWSAYVQVSAP